MKLYDLLDKDLLDEMLKEGFVRQQSHPSMPLKILNYTERAQYTKTWNDVTQKCRGLIYNEVTQDIVARPFEKFFNYGEHEEGTLDLDAPVFVTDKLDGSLGILYWAGALPWIATRGSFTSEQAVHATELFRERYADRWEPLEGFTELFEVIYSGNRIVLDYGDTDDLFHLGSVNIETGRSYPPRTSGPAPAAENFWLEVETLREALAMPPRGKEGVVVHFIDTDKRVKIKEESYVALHRIITGMNARTVWEALGEGKTADELCEGVPEEFWPWIQGVAGELQGKAEQVRQAAKDTYKRLLENLWEDSLTEIPRKEFAAMACTSEYRALLFMLLDGRDIKPAIWKSLKPSGDRALVAHSEDTA